MKAFLITLLQLISLMSFSQFALVKDKDGFSNVRSEAKASGKIIDTVKNGRLVFCYEKFGNWVMVDYLKGKEYIDGYIYSDRLKMIDEYKELKAKEETAHRSTYRYGDIVVSISTEPFKKTTEKFQYYKDNTEQIEFINGKPYYGRDGGYPTSRYKNITITIKGKSLTLPFAAIENLFEPNLALTKAFYDEQNDILYIHSSNGDGAGNYEVIWRIEKGKYRDRNIAFGF